MSCIIRPYPPRLADPHESDVYAVAGVYRIRNMINGKVYVGSSVNVRNRLNRHRRWLLAGRHGNRHLQAAFNAHGRDAFVFDVVDAVHDAASKRRLGLLKPQLLQWEQLWMDHYGSCDQELGYNINPRAESCLGVVHSEETRRKASAAQRISQNRPEVLEATRRRAVERKLYRNFGDVSGANNGMYGSHRTGSSNPFHGRSHTEGTRAAIRKALTGRKLSEEHRKRVAEGGRIAQNRPDVREANRQRSRGSGNPMHGKSVKDSMTPEAFNQMRSRMSASGKQAWADPERHRRLSEILRRRHLRNYLVAMRTRVVQDWT